MGNLGNGIKKFLQNKNTVTVVGIVIVIVVLFFAYNYRVNRSTNPISVPYATEEIKSGVQITENMVGTTQITGSMADQLGIIRTQSEVIDRYSNADTIIPKGSLFYERNVVSKEDLPASIILDVKKGHTLYQLHVDTYSTYGNTIYPNSYIDIWVKINLPSGVCKTTDGKASSGIWVTRFIENVKVISVEDGEGEDVFADPENIKSPAWLIFSVPEDYFILLKKLEYLKQYDTELDPVPLGSKLDEESGEVTVSSEDLQKCINELTDEK